MGRHAFSGAGGGQSLKSDYRREIRISLISKTPMWVVGNEPLAGDRATDMVLS